MGYTTKRSLGTKVTALLVALATSLGVTMLAAPNAAAQDNRGNLRPGCSWSDYRFFVQNCWVHSAAMGQDIQVQIKPSSRGGNAGLYMLDGLRARQDWNAWTWQGHGVDHFVDDDVTVVMPVGGMAQFYTDWQGPFTAPGAPANPKWETFLTRELPPYLQQNFGVAPDRNAILGLSMGALGALNLAGWHRDQFKHVTSLSGYLNPTWPGMYTALQIAIGDATGFQVPIWNMWGNPLDLARFRNDPMLNVGNFSGMPMYLAAAGGIATLHDTILGDPVGFLVGTLLEWMARTDTAKFELAVRVAGAQPVVSYPFFGIHNWGVWGEEVGRARPHILGALGV